MAQTEWIQGGPLLAVSFLMQLKEGKKQTVQEILNKLSEVKTPIEVVDEDVEEMINYFDRGYPFDESDSPIMMHTIRLELYVTVLRKRKALLQTDLVSSNSIMVNFCFYGDELDVPEWDQIGIVRSERIAFTYFLEELNAVYSFILGGVAFEEGILAMFDVNETYPSECYRYENLSPENHQKIPTPFIHIIWSEIFTRS